MIAYIKGELVEVLNEKIIIDTGSIGVAVNVPLTVIENLPKKGEKIMLHTYFKVAEDMMSLYGFNTIKDLEIFKLLITVNGIGPKGAMSILSSIEPQRLRVAIISNDYNTISNAKGIGKKTAQKIILELKDKISIEETISNITSNFDEEFDNTCINESIEALVSLGYSKNAVIKTINSIEDKENKDTQTLISLVLKNI